MDSRDKTINVGGNSNGRSGLEYGFRLPFQVSKFRTLQYQMSV